MNTFNGSTVAILGLSVEGLDSAKFFHAHGARVWCCDRRTKEELGYIYEELQQLSEGFQLGDEYLKNLDRFDIIVRTPGMSPRLPELNVVRKKLTSLTQIFFKRCRAPVIGVTGTKGKGTTSTLIAQMLKAEGMTVWFGGNVGTPLLSRVDDIQENDKVVLELSSFQLEDLTLSPHIAVVLRTTQEHLANQDKLATNYHPSREAYVEAKKSIVRFQKSDDYAVLNMEDPTSRSFARETKASVLYFTRTRAKGDAYVTDETVYLFLGNRPKKICSLSEIKLLGVHNLDNIAAASLAASLAGVGIEQIRKAARDFSGLEHRLEIVREINNVLYVNDSFSTVPETAIAAIESFTKPIILIAGGSEKGSDFTELGKTIGKRNVKTLIAIGAMTERIVDAAVRGGYTGSIVTGLQSMRDIVRKCAEISRPGDVVLLSPACASFDMFKNYKERGTVFKHEVSLL